MSRPRGCRYARPSRPADWTDGPAAASPSRPPESPGSRGLLLPVLAQPWPELVSRLAESGAHVDVTAAFPVADAVRIRQRGRHRHAGEELAEVGGGAAVGGTGRNGHH